MEGPSCLDGVEKADSSFPPKTQLRLLRSVFLTAEYSQLLKWLTVLYVDGVFEKVADRS